MVENGVIMSSTQQKNSTNRGINYDTNNNCYFLVLVTTTHNTTEMLNNANKYLSGAAVFMEIGKAAVGLEICVGN